jgi:hypothetical protein
MKLVLTIAIFFTLSATAQESDYSRPPSGLSKFLKRMGHGSYSRYSSPPFPEPAPDLSNISGLDQSLVTSSLGWYCENPPIDDKNSCADRVNTALFNVGCGLRTDSTCGVVTKGRAMRSHRNAWDCLGTLTHCYLTAASFCASGFKKGVIPKIENVSLKGRARLCVTDH